MSPGLMLRMVIGMGDRRNGQEPVHKHQAEQHRPHEPGLFQSRHHKKLSERRRLDRFLFLDFRNHLEDHLFGQQASFNIFLHTALLINEHAHR